MPKRVFSSRAIPNAPSRTLWIIAMVAGILGLLGQFVAIELLTPNSFALLAVGFVLLAIGTTSRI